MTSTDSVAVIDRVAQHIKTAADYIDKVYPTAKMLDRGPIMKNMRRWHEQLSAALASHPARSPVQAGEDGPHFADTGALADWLESLHETNDDGAVTDRIWEPAQLAASVLRSDSAAVSMREQEALLNPATQVFFRAGLIACREYMARFVEVESPSIAASIRANWWPSLGQDFGPPRQVAWDEVTDGEFGTETFRVKGADEVSPTQEALPIAFHFLGGQSTTPQPAQPSEQDAVAWQQRYIDVEEGPGIWQPCDADNVALFLARPGYEVRPLYAAPPLAGQREDAELAGTLNELREHIATISGSALLAGEKHGIDDKDTLYREACSALCSVEYAISLFTRPASAGAVDDETLLMAEWIGRHAYRMNRDHACPECVPEGGDLVDPAFTCAVHIAKRLTSQQAEDSESDNSEYRREHDSHNMER